MKLWDPKSKSIDFLSVLFLHDQVLFGLEYAHSIAEIKKVLPPSISGRPGSTSVVEILYADVICSLISPSETCGPANQLGPVDSQVANQSLAEGTIQNYSIGGLSWKLPQGRKMEDYLLFWIGLDCPAFANVVLTFNSCEIGMSLHICTYALKLIRK